MHGWIHDMLERMVIEERGLAVWETIKSQAGCEDVPVGQWKLLDDYPDAMTLGLVGAVCSVLNESGDVLLERFGRFFMVSSRKQGYSNLLACQGQTLRSWLSNVNELHEHLKQNLSDSFVFPELYCSDDLSCDDADQDNFLLHYSSTRGATLAPLVVGIVKDVAEYYFSLQISMLTISLQGGSDGSKYSTWKIRRIGKCLVSESDASDQEGNIRWTKPPIMVNGGGAEGGASRCPFSGIPMPSESSRALRCPFSGAIIEPGIESQAADALGAERKQAGTPVSQDDACGGMSSAMMSEVFPFYLKFNQTMVITHAGGQVKNFMPSLRVGESKISDIFALDFPHKVSVSRCMNHSPRK